MTKKELIDENKKLEEKLIDKEFERYSQVQRLTTLILYYENICNENGLGHKVKNP